MPPVLDVLRHRPGDAQPVIGAGPAPDLVQQDKAPAGRTVEDLRGLGHFDHERALAAREVVEGPHAREHAVHETDAGLPRRHETAHLRQQHDQRDLPEIRALSGHVRARDEQQPIGLEVQEDIVGNEPACQVQPFHHRVPAFADSDRSPFIHLGTDITVDGGRLRQHGQHIQQGNGCPHRLETGRFSGKLGADLLEELLFQRVELLLGAGHPLFELFQLGGREPLRVDESLLATVMRGNTRQVRLGHLDVIAEDLIESHFQ